jgi:hypothetical protein
MMFLIATSYQFKIVTDSPAVASKYLAQFQHAGIVTPRLAKEGQWMNVRAIVVEKSSTMISFVTNAQQIQ